MASAVLPTHIADTFVKGVLTPETALAVRKAIYAHRRLNANDMDLVFAVARKAGPNPCGEWTKLFSEAVTDYVVHQAEPEDHISEEMADWLMTQLRDVGGLSSKCEFAMLLDVMNSALSVPPALSAFALNEIKTAIITGRRGAISDGDHPAGTVTKFDVEALRAVLFAATSGSACHITQEEAEALFDIAHGTAGPWVDPSFDDLFARAVGNYLMATCAHNPRASETLHREKWLDERESIVGFLSRTLSRAPMGFFDALKSPLELADEDMGKIEAKDEAERSQSEQVTDEEGAWVLAHLTRSGKLTSAENRLLQFLGAEASSIPSSLRDLVKKATSAKTRAA